MSSPRVASLQSEEASSCRGRRRFSTCEFPRRGSPADKAAAKAIAAGHGKVQGGIHGWASWRGTEPVGHNLAIMTKLRRLNPSLARFLGGIISYAPGGLRICCRNAARVARCREMDSWSRAVWARSFRTRSISTRLNGTRPPTHSTSSTRTVAWLSWSLMRVSTSSSRLVMASRPTVGMAGGSVRCRLVPKPVVLTVPVEKPVCHHRFEDRAADLRREIPQAAALSKRHP